jgi:hypothetical protein
MGRSKELPWLFFFKAMAAKALAFFIFRRGKHDYCNEKSGNRKTN